MYSISTVSVLELFRQLLVYFFIYFIDFPVQCRIRLLCHNHHTRTVIIHLSLLILKLYFCLFYLYVLLILLNGHQSRYTTASLSYLPSQKSLRFLTHHHRHRQTPHRHTDHHKHPSHHTHIHMSQIHVRLPHFLIHRSTTVTPNVHNHSYASLPHPPSKQTDAITKVNNWMNDGYVCSNSSSSCEAETAASVPAPATYAEAATGSPTQPPSLTMASPIHSPTHLNTYTHPASSCQAQTILIDNITTKHTRAEIEIKLRRQFPGGRYALTSLKRGGLALVLQTIKEIITILKNKMGRGFLWERPQGRAAEFHDR